MSDERKHETIPGGQMTWDQVNKNFVAMNEWMKLERKERDELQAKYDKLSVAFAKQDQEMQQIKQQLGLILAKLHGGGATVT